jgi:cobalt-zinc-cadmium efflux system membrane fusion protein
MDARHKEIEMNNKRCFPLILVLCLLGSGCNQANRSEMEEAAQMPAKQTDSEQSNELIGRNRNGSGRGMGRGRSVAPRRGLGQGRYQPITISQNEEGAIDIETVAVAYKALSKIHPAMGKVLAPTTKMALVSYAFPARISQIHVQVGEWVKKDQLLLTLQSEEVGHAKSEYFKAAVDLELAKTNLERGKRLFDRGVGPQKNYIARQAEVRVAEASLEAAEKKLHVLGFSEEDVERIASTHEQNPTIRLFAPISGEIVEHKSVLGAMIDQSSELMTIMDPTTLWIDAEIYERDIAKIRIGQNVEASVPAYPDESFTGKISYIGDQLNDETRTITVRAEVENLGYKLKPGMFADIRIHLNHASKALVLPREAILDDNNEQIVFVKTNGSYAAQVVEVGIKENGFCEIRSGIKQGDEVVVKGNYQLKSKLYEELLGSQVH